MYYGNYQEFDGDYNMVGLSRSAKDINGLLEPLISRMKDFDNLRVNLEKQGGVPSDIEYLTQLLETPIKLPLNFFDEEKKIKLCDRDSLRRAISIIGRGSLSIGLRHNQHGFPVFYLCRTNISYWGKNHSMILYDIYISPGYPMDDMRYVPIMSNGRERSFLRLSPFRNLLENNPETKLIKDIDDVENALINIGQSIFQAAWNPDQQMAWASAINLQLKSFGFAIELLYFCLSSDLNDLRSNKPEEMMPFLFVYKNPWLYKLMENSLVMDATETIAMQNSTLKLYKQLQLHFYRFLKTEVLWNHDKFIPLYKILLANFSRLDRTSKLLLKDPVVIEASATLEKGAENIIHSFIDGNNVNTRQKA